jgi:hypothetical protein
VPYHVVEAGDCISSIAYQYGFFPDTVWNHPSNSSLKELRKNMNVLLPGDSVFVPDKEIKNEPSATDRLHKFRVRGVPAKLRIRIYQDGKEVANTPYLLTIDDRKLTGSTDGGGLIVVSIPPNAQSGILIVQTHPDPLEYDLELGQLPPVETIPGIKARLSNLGFGCDNSGDELDDETKAALRAFQQHQGLTVSGNPDAATLARLREEHDEH